jgi:hypothetical protein
MQPLTKYRKHFCVITNVTTISINSPYSRRGVGILLACDIQYKIINTLMDKDSNILCLTLETDAGKCAIMSVYGPNENSKLFFLNLSEFLNKIGNIPVIIGGD